MKVAASITAVVGAAILKFVVTPLAKIGDKMLEFKTSKGNTYAWDDDVGLFIPFSPTMKMVLSEISSCDFLSKEHVIERLKRNFEEKEVAFCYDWIKKWQKIKHNDDETQPFQRFDSSYIKKYILRHGLLSLTLGVTEDCNFRCKYCTFSEFYKYTRDHSDKYMDFPTAKKAIDHFFSLLFLGRRFHPVRKPIIGFYGGEPLLNFKLVKKCVEYVDESYHSFEASYGLTTNGSLMDEEKADWLMEHDFSIAISLDGPEEEHNRLRVYRNGNGTFKDVMRNVGYIMRVGYDKINSAPVFDWKSDLFERDDFFKEKGVPSIARVALVNDGKEGCEYFNQFSEEDRLSHLEQVERARNYYFNNLDSRVNEERASFFDKMVGLVPIHELFGSDSIFPPHPIMPFTGSCVPGRKLFVDVKGNFHVCEKVNYAFPIGNVEEGLNFEKIGSLISNYLNHMDKCSNCKVVRQCHYCYVTFMTNGGFLPSSQICEEIELKSRQSFAKTLEIAESNIEFLEKSNSGHRNIKKFFGGKNVFQA